MPRPAAVMEALRVLVSSSWVVENADRLESAESAGLVPDLKLLSPALNEDDVDEAESEGACVPCSCWAPRSKSDGCIFCVAGVPAMPSRRLSYGGERALCVAYGIVPPRVGGCRARCICVGALVADCASAARAVV